MTYIGPILALIFIVLVARLILKKYYPHAVLLIAGLLMLGIASALGMELPALFKPTGFKGFDLFAFIKESFSDTNAGVGLMIMAIGGFVAYTDKIGASKALVHLAMKPLHLLKRHPNLTAVCVIPIGQMLFITIPSAAGLGLLLMASVFPILIGLGVSRLSAVSIITACTALGLGPASAMTAAATTIIGKPIMTYFLGFQIPLIIPLTITLMITYFFVNRYFDNKEQEKPTEVNDDVPEVKQEEPEAPKIYALIPVLPLLLLIIFSEIFSFFPTPIVLDTTTAMIISMFIALIFEWVRKGSIKEVMASLATFWNGMGNIFKTVVTLIIAADIFSKGLIALGFIEGLVMASQSIGLSAIAIGVVMTIMIFLAAMLMGSGNAAFFAFGPLVPDIAAKFGVESTRIILPMNMAASMGRTVSPVSGVLIATAEIAGVATLSIVKRNLIPLGITLVVMLIYHFI